MSRAQVSAHTHALARVAQPLSRDRRQLRRRVPRARRSSDRRRRRRAPHDRRRGPSAASCSAHVHRRLTIARTQTRKGLRLASRPAAAQHGDHRLQRRQRSSPPQPPRKRCDASTRPRRTALALRARCVRRRREPWAGPTTSSHSGWTNTRAPVRSTKVRFTLRDELDTRHDTKSVHSHPLIGGRMISSASASKRGGSRSMGKRSPSVRIGVATTVSLPSSSS